LLSAWFVWAAVVSDFDELGLFLLGFLGLVFLLVLKWDTRLFWLRLFAAVLLLFSILATGRGLFLRGVEVNAFREAVARTTLVEVGRMVKLYSEKEGDLPDYPFSSMAKELEERGYFHGITIRVEWEGEPVAFSGIPLKDGWNCRYFFKKLSRSGFVLRSSGADRRFDTLDDITVSSSWLFVLEKRKARVPRGLFRAIAEAAWISG